MVDGTAVILVSDPLFGRGDANQGEPWWWEALPIGKHKYRLRLEIRVPGRQPYEMEGKFKVPLKAERTGALTWKPLHAGITLPVRVDPDDPRRVDVDWRRFIADPGRKAQVGQAHDLRRQEVTRQQLARNPELMAKQRESNRLALPGWIQAVRAGNMSRAELEQQIDGEVATGRMDPAHADWARQQLDG